MINFFYLLDDFQNELHNLAISQKTGTNTPPRFKFASYKQRCNNYGLAYVKLINGNMMNYNTTT